MVSGNVKYSERRKRTVLRFLSDVDPRVTYQCKLDDNNFKDCELYIDSTVYVSFRLVEAYS